MIRLGWRQFRTQALVAGIVLVVLAVVLVATGLHLRDLYHANVAHCGRAGDCTIAEVAFLGHERFLRTTLGPLLVVAPALAGLFWGAPLVARELETGTYRLAWTQSVSRTRWLVAKLGIGVLASMLVVGALSWMVTWWFSPVDTVNAARYSTFSERDLVPLAYAAFAFALGAAAGTVMRRTLPATATTLVGFVAVRVAVTEAIRPHLIGAKHLVQSLTSPNMQFGLNKSFGTGSVSVVVSAHLPDAWVYSARIVNQAGHAPSRADLQSSCPAALGGGAGPAGPGVFHACLAKLSAQYHVVVTYQPASRYWSFQGAETALFVVAAAALLALCIWWTRNRLR